MKFSFFSTNCLSVSSNYSSAGVNGHWLQHVAYVTISPEWTRKSGLLTATRDCLFTNILTVKPCHFKV